MKKRTGWHHRGAVLIFLLILLSLFVFLGGIYARHSLIETRVAQNHLRNMEAYYLAEGGMSAVLMILKDRRDLLEDGFVLEGRRPGGTFILSPGNPTAEGRELVSRSTVQGALGEVVTEVVPGLLFDKGALAVKDLSLLGFSGIIGNLHVNSSLILEGTGNYITGDFSYSGPDAVFRPESDLVLAKAGLTAVAGEELHPFWQDFPRPLPGYNGKFYENQGFVAFHTFSDYLADEYAQEDGPKKVLVTGKMDTREIAGEIAFHGVLAVSAPADIYLSGLLNRSPGREESQVLLAALKDQNISITPNFTGELEMGGSWLILTRGDILLEGASGLSVKGAMYCRHLSITEGIIHYAPDISPDLQGILTGLPVLKARWLKIH